MSEQIKELKPRKALNKAFLKVKPNRTEIEGFKTNLIQIPIPNTDERTKEALIKLVEQAITKREQNQQAEISELENKIDQLVYQLYDLTEEEIAIVESSSK